MFQRDGKAATVLCRSPDEIMKRAAEARLAVGMVRRIESTKAKMDGDTAFAGARCGGQGERRRPSSKLNPNRAVCSRRRQCVARSAANFATAAAEVPVGGLVYYPDRTVGSGTKTPRPGLIIGPAVLL
jgi:hypothetical protein